MVSLPLSPFFSQTLIFPLSPSLSSLIEYPLPLSAIGVVIVEKSCYRQEIMTEKHHKNFCATAFGGFTKFVENATDRGMRPLRKT